MRILIISNNYPTVSTPYSGVFVEAAAKEFIRQNNEVSVIAPISVTSQVRRFGRVSRHKSEANVHDPRYFSFPLTLTPSVLRFARLNDWIMSRAISRAVSKLGGEENFDVCYTHFVPSGLAALNSISKIPVFLTIGESDLSVYDANYGERWISRLEEFSGVFTVSETLRNEILKRNTTISSKLFVTPNGVDADFFSPFDRNKARQMLGIDQDVRLATFVGHFIERKGPLRVLKAIERIGFRGCFLGTGKQKPTGPSVLYSGKVNRESLRLWLAASDCFVLPSLAEGRSNAILEALAMGIPCVVSDLQFNREFLSHDEAVLIDPTAEEKIADGILYATARERTEMFKLNGRRLAVALSHSRRIEKIVRIMKAGLVQ